MLAIDVGLSQALWHVRYAQRVKSQVVIGEPMKPLPAPHVPGKTEFERFDNAVRRALSISKEELLKREAREKKTRERKKRGKI